MAKFKYKKLPKVAPQRAQVSPHSATPGRQAAPRSATTCNGPATGETLSRARFANRWRVAGTLTALSDIHIGSGATYAHPRLKTPEGEDVEVDAVARNAAGVPVVTATALKNAVRRWFVRQPHSQASTVMRRLLGEDGGQGQAGRLEFLDAVATRSPTGDELPYYSSGAYVAARVSIDRVTRTAVDALLFYQERVPATTEFAATVTGENLTIDDIAWLLAALKGAFGSEASHGHAVGASTSAGCGALSWAAGDLRRLDRAGVASWLRQGKVGYDGFDRVPDGEVLAITAQADAFGSGCLAAASLEIMLDVLFAGSFIVNDPSRTRERDSQDPTRFNLDYLRDEQGRIALNGTSLKQALRAQAERIVRTKFGESCACRATSANRCKAIQEIADVGGLCLVCRLFGGVGWKSPLSVTRFTPAQQGAAVLQGVEDRRELLAVDRFTGGGADGLKFRARTRFRPSLRGCVTLDLDRLASAGVLAPALGLLFHVLGDAVEGDIAVGFGRSKGWGRFVVNSGALAWNAPADLLPAGRQAYLGGWTDVHAQLVAPVLEAFDTFQTAVGVTQ